MADQEKDPKENILTAAAKAVGKAAGKIAHIAGVEVEAPPKKSTKPAKLEKKNKSRLPRREKKAQKKAA